MRARSRLNGSITSAPEDIEHGRRMVDAIRELMGLRALYYPCELTLPEWYEQGALDRDPGHARKFPTVGA